MPVSTRFGSVNRRLSKEAGEPEESEVRVFFLGFIPELLVSASVWESFPYSYSQYSLVTILFSRSLGGNNLLQLLPQGPTLPLAISLNTTDNFINKCFTQLSSNCPVWECHFSPARTITNKLKLIKWLLARAVTLSLSSTLSMEFKLGETGVKHLILLVVKGEFTNNNFRNKNRFCRKWKDSTRILLTNCNSKYIKWENT